MEVVEMALAALLGAPLVLYALWRLYNWYILGGARLPPVQSGWLPWVGCAMEFGREPLYFIDRTRRKKLFSSPERCLQMLGDIFTIHAAGKKMTFVTNHHDYQHYFTTAKADFQAAVQPFTKRAAGLPSSSFFKHHSAIHDTIKGRLVPSYLTKMCPVLSEEFHTSLLSHGEQGEIDLMDFVRNAMFEAVVKQLFGHDNVPQEKVKMREFIKKFVKYDADFEYGAELPEIFLKDWKECKYWLLSLFKVMVEGIREKGAAAAGQGQSLLVEQLMNNVDEPSAHNYALLLLWASQANAVPAVFWCLAHIIADKELHKSLKDSIKKLDIFKPGGEFCPMTEQHLKQLMPIKRCVLETIRLHSPGMITRKVTETHTINGYTIPAGHLLMLSPYWSHRNERKFPNPEQFIPDRWLDCDLEKNQFLDGFVGFGGGRYQCPGRWFALMEMHLFVAMVIGMFDLELLDVIPSPSPLHLVGTQQPTSSCRITFSRT